ncbi:MAG: hypothetical protein Q4D43_11460, partial [Clostridia bacterium]|nr:hypothetical protein [Clostridia bacterium]
MLPKLGNAEFSVRSSTRAANRLHTSVYAPSLQPLFPCLAAFFRVWQSAPLQLSGGAELAASVAGQDRLFAGYIEEVQPVYIEA